MVSLSKDLEKDQKHSRSATDILLAGIYTKPINLPPRPKEKHFVLVEKQERSNGGWLSDLGDYLIIFTLLFNKTVLLAGC